MASFNGSSLPPSESRDIDVRGSVPPGLSGRMLGIDRDGVVHSVVVTSELGASYQTQQLRAEATVDNVVVFGGTILAFSDDSHAHALSAALDTFRPVDLAGQSRLVAPFPKHDPVTRDLHLVARAHDGTQSHIIVTAGALIRSGRPIIDVPRRITDLALTADRVVFVAPGFVGIAPRTGEARATWIPTDAPAVRPVHAHDADDTVVLLALSPSLERWTLRWGAGSVEREMLDPTPRRFAHLSDDGANGAPRWLWTTGDETICRHDLVGSQEARHSLRPHVPGDFAVVSDAARPDDNNVRYLVGFVHDPASTTSDLRVTDAAHIGAPAAATVRIPRPIPHGLRWTWIPEITTDHHSN